MDQLLPYYERELVYLRECSREFALRYSKIATRLSITDGSSEDPQVERLMQTFSLLTARIRKKLEDDYPEFTESFLEVLYPHYLRPFPSCSIAQFDNGNQNKASVFIPRGNQLESDVIQGVECEFKTVFDVTIAPVNISKAKFSPMVVAPREARLPPSSTGCVSISISCTDEALSFDDFQLDKLRVYMHGEPSFVSALRDCLFLKSIAFFVEVDESGKWYSVQNSFLREVGFSPDEAMIPYPKQSQSAYRLLTEYFAFPEKFNFFDIDLKAIKSGIRGAKTVTLHLVLNQLNADSTTARMLESLSDTHLRLGCTPVINLFEQVAQPIVLNKSAKAYPVTVTERNQSCYEVYEITSVDLIKESSVKNDLLHFYPLYSLEHGEIPTKGGRYWTVQRDEMVALKSPGYETEISLVEFDLNLIQKQCNTLSVQLTCTNRDLPTQIAIGLPQGDLKLTGGQVKKVKLLKKLSRPLYFERDRFMHWRLISHLAVNHLSLTNEGLPALKTMLKLYNFENSTITTQQIAGIVAIDHKPAMTWMSFKPRGSYIRGIEIQLTMNEDNFVGSSMHSFIRVLDHFFGLYVHGFSFIQLVVISNRTKEELIRCLPRCGDAIIV